MTCRQRIMAIRLMEKMEKSSKITKEEDGTMVYIKDTNHTVFKQAFKENEELIKISRGDKLRVVYEPMENQIHMLTEFTFLPATS